jgi:hypothetical protein
MVLSKIFQLYRGGQLMQCQLSVIIFCLEKKTTYGEMDTKKLI